MLNRLKEILTKDFKNLDDILAFYREVLPQRTEGYHQDEIGPIIPENSSAMARKFASRIFDLGGYTMEMKDKLDWYATPTGDLEWNGGFVRHGHFVVMANEYQKTKEEKYPREIIAQMTDYIKNVPVYNPEGKPYLEYKKSTWRPFEAAARAGETWPEALGKILHSPSVTPEEWGTILLSLHEHGVFLRKHHWKRGNHAVGEVAALGILTLFFQEFPESEEWRSYAVDFLMNMWEKQFHEDYYTNEMSGGYHWVAMRSFFAFYEVGKKNGFESLFPPLYVERLVQASLAEMYQEKPDYSVPVTNDSSSKSNRREQLIRVNKMFKRPDIAYRLSGGREGTPPEQSSRFFEDARVGFMRSDWSEKANYLFFDMGRWGDNHMNEDQLNIELSAYGRNILNNCGRWRYTTSPDVDWLEEARYFKTTAAYNSLLIDGYCQQAGDAEGFMKTTDSYDYAKGVFRGGYGTKDYLIADAIHTRKIIFVKPDFFILIDEVNSKELHEAELVFHYRTGELAQSRGAFLTQFDQGNLVLKSLSEGELITETFRGSRDPFRGWHCPYYDQREPAPELSIKQKGRGKIVFNTLLFPVEGTIKEIPDYSVKDSHHKISYENRTWEITVDTKGEINIKTS
ncbi:MAG: alginate lyase family protein [Spirochaetales bacterium]|nr:alginate lyase family protein [Spirochaetales bacterium]